MKRAPYTECKLFYDTDVGGVDVGHYLKTEAGSAYLITSVRPNRNRPERLQLICLRWPSTEVPPDAVVHPLFWYPREKKAARRIPR